MCRKKNLYSGIVIIVFTCLLLSNSSLFVNTCHAEQYKLIPSVIHIHTTIGNGENTPEEIVEIARASGIKVVIFTDHDTMKWTYGVPPLRTIIQKVVDQNSIHKYGPANYINTIEELNKKYPDMVLIHGTESIPFYYWQGSIFKKNPALVKGNEHILVFGLKTPSDYKNLPSVGNGFPEVYDIEGISVYGLLVFSYSDGALLHIVKNHPQRNMGIRAAKYQASYVYLLGLSFW